MRRSWFDTVLVVAILLFGISALLAGAQVRSLEDRLYQAEQQIGRMQWQTATDGKSSPETEPPVTYDLSRNSDGFITEAASNDGYEYMTTFFDASDQDKLWMRSVRRGAAVESNPGPLRYDVNVPVSVDGAEKQIRVTVYASVPKDIRNLVDFYNSTHQPEKVEGDDSTYQGTDDPLSRYPDLSDDASKSEYFLTFDHLMVESVYAIEFDAEDGQLLAAVDESCLEADENTKRPSGCYNSSGDDTQGFVDMLNQQYGNAGVVFYTEGSE